ncbi:MAG: hypothetical protein Fur0037_15930 [Planctomycetota bacterium]
MPVSKSSGSESLKKPSISVCSGLWERGFVVRALMVASFLWFWNMSTGIGVAKARGMPIPAQNLKSL